MRDRWPEIIGCIMMAIFLANIIMGWMAIDAIKTVTSMAKP